jgi:mannan endo-1,4-beta-mannosidase
MRKLQIHYLFLMLFIGLPLACSSDEDGPGEEIEQPIEKTTLSLADQNATAKTKALYSNLWAIQEVGFMFGHHDDLFYGRRWYNEPGRSDTKDVVGDYPAVLSIDFAPIMDDRYESDASENEIRERVCKEAYNRGMVITACLHLNNPLTGGDSWDNSSDQVAIEILKDGSSTQIEFNKWLDRLADFALNLKGDDGEIIPIILRPFHEHTQSWSWWGSTCTTTSQYIALWKYTIDYLKNDKGVHSFIYAISPQMDSVKSIDDFYYRWPGDNYVDFIGMDSYQGINNNVFVNNLRSLSTAAMAKKKPCGVTEIGVEGFSKEDYWTNNILAPMTGRKVSMVVTWRNKYDPAEEGSHYFSVFKGHVSENDFVTFYNNPLTFFAANLPDMYTMAENVIL